MGFLSRIPEAVLKGGLEAAGTLIGAKIGAGSADKAAELQAGSTREALEFEREQAAEAEAAYKAAWDDYIARRNWLLSHYGVDAGPLAMPSGAPGPPSGPPQGGPPPGAAPQGMPPGEGPMGPRGRSLKDLMASGDYSDLYDWRRYGLR